MEKSEKYFLIPLFSGAITSVTYFRLGKLVTPAILFNDKGSGVGVQHYFGYNNQ